MDVETVANPMHHPQPSLLPAENPTRSFWLAAPAAHPHLTRMRSATLPTEADVVIIGSGMTGAAAAWAILGDGINGKEIARDSTTTTTTKPISATSTPPLPTVVVLEARETCGGATGRNGGHIKSCAHELFALVKSRLVNQGGLSVEAAARSAAAVVRFQRRHIDLLVGLCEAQGWNAAEARSFDTADFYLDQAEWERGLREVDELNRWVPEINYQTWTAEQAREKFNASSHVVGAFSYSAGAMFPHRLVTSVWSTLLDALPRRTLAFETFTPATSVSCPVHVDLLAAGSPDGSDRYYSSSYPYLVTTPRGTVRARHVLHATNAHAAHLVPGLRDCISPLRGHVAARFVGDTGTEPLTGKGTAGMFSYSAFYSGGSFDYVTQRPPRPRPPSLTRKDNEQVNGLQLGCGGELIIGGGLGDGRMAQETGRLDDNALEPAVLAHIMGAKDVVLNPRSTPATRAAAEWSGIIAMTGDFLPLVGRLGSDLTRRSFGSVVGAGTVAGEVEVAGAAAGIGVGTGTGTWTGAAASSDYDDDGVSVAPPGEWIAAGYNGEGMVSAWLCATAVGLMIVGRDGEDWRAGADETRRRGRPPGRVADWLPAVMQVDAERVRGRARV